MKSPELHPDYRREIIDTFVNSVYVYDDRLLLTYNYKDGSQTLPLKEIEAALSSDFSFLSKILHTEFMPPVLPAAESGALYIRRNIPPSVTAILSSGPSLRELFHLDQVIRSGSVAQCGGSLDGVDAVPAFNSFQ